MKIIQATAVLAVLALGTTPGWARECPGPDCAVVRQDGVTGDNLFATIGDAVFNASALGYTHIEVHPGRYAENLFIVLNGISIRAVDGPLLTCIVGTTAEPTIRVHNNMTFQVVGFTITGTGDGVYVSPGSTVSVHNCVIEGNSGSGVYIYRYEQSDPVPTLSLINNVIMRNGLDGLAVRTEYTGLMANVNAHNNIFYDNVRFGFAIFPQSGIVRDEKSNLKYTYNLMAKGQGEADYSPTISSAGFPVSASLNPTATLPGFVNSVSGCGSDVRLLTTSNALNQGWDTSAYRDVDGSRNDMGAFGGPRAEGYFRQSNQGPVVRDLEGPTQIREGDGSFVIQGVGASR